MVNNYQLPLVLPAPLFRVPYTLRGATVPWQLSTTFMQNKPNFPDDQMNVSDTIIKDYENTSNWKLGKNKANTKPLKPNFRKVKMKLSFYSTKDYENKSNWKPGENKANTKPLKPNFKGKNCVCLNLKIYRFFQFYLYHTNGPFVKGNLLKLSDVVHFSNKIMQNAHWGK